MIGVFLASRNQVKNIAVNKSPMYCDMTGKNRLCLI